MSNNVIEIGPRLVGDGISLDPDSILEHAVGKLETALVVGIQPDGEIYVAGTEGVAESVFLMERAKAWFIQNEVMRRV